MIVDPATRPGGSNATSQRPDGGNLAAPDLIRPCLTASAQRWVRTIASLRRDRSTWSPAVSRKSPRVAEVLPLLYLHGLSSSDFGPALSQFLGSDAGLSAATITRMTAQWQDEATSFGSGLWPARPMCMCGSTAST